MNATPQNDLRHLFDGTHCLSKRQLRDYAASFSSSGQAGSMSREEAYAVESHLNSCPLCSAAVDGMLAHFPESADVLATVDAGFLKDHFKKHSPQIHLNTVAPAATAPVTRRIPGSGRVIDLTTFRTVGIAAAVVLLVGSLWWFQNPDGDGESLSTSAPIAQAEEGTKTSSSGSLSSIPESERRLAQAASATADRAPAKAANAAGEKKTTGELLAEADVALGNAVPQSAPPSPDAKPVNIAAAVPAENEAVVNKDAGMEDAANLTSTQKTGDVAVRARRYERPLIEPKQPASRTVLTDKEVERMPTRNPMDAASTAPGVYQSRGGQGLNIGGGRGENTVYVVDGVVQSGKAKKAEDEGKTLYKKGSYAAALKVFKQQMATSSGSTREEATLYAARCHRALGQTKAAEKLLKNLADGKGSNARAARRELRDMDADYDKNESGRRASGSTTTKGDDR